MSNANTHDPKGDGDITMAVSVRLRGPFKDPPKTDSPASRPGTAGPTAGVGEQGNAVGVDPASPAPAPGVPRCKTCGGGRIVATAWPSGYPHATPCPECRPNDPCECVGTTNCPSAEAVAAWKAAHRPGQDDAIRAAVAAERERCLAWANAAWLGHAQIQDLIRSGEPAPTVKP